MNLKLEELQVFDSHCHPQLAQYDRDREEVIQRTKLNKIGIICVGTDLVTSKQGIELAEKYDNIWTTVGIHPNDVDDLVISQVHGLDGLLGQSKIVALGEIGLDYFRTPEPERQEKQKEFFKKFLELAVKYDKPIILHARDSAKGSTGQVHSDMISIIRNFNTEIFNTEQLAHDTKLETLNTKYSTPNIGLRGVAHSFTGSTEDAQKYLDLGFYIGLNGIITFTTQYNEMIKSIPLDRILVETDAPYLTPEPYRSKPPFGTEKIEGKVRNEPSFVSHVVDKLATVKGVSKEEISTQTTLNCIKLFKLDQF